MEPKPSLTTYRSNVAMIRMEFATPRKPSFVEA
ncbi:hypothetical protein FHT86_000925 [Rhizobium sp. BK313]|nr:hypothetical protein [Rhizobium sp. BK313]